MFVRSPTLPVAFLPQYDRKVAIWHKWQSFGREVCAELSLEVGVRRQIKHGFRRREAVNHRDGRAIGRFFSDFASERWDCLVVVVGKGANGERVGRGVDELRRKVHEFFGKEEEFSRKVVGFPLALAPSFCAVVADWGKMDGGAKKTPRIPKNGGVCTRSSLALFVRGYALASGAPKGVAVRPTPSVATG